MHKHKIGTISSQTKWNKNFRADFGFIVKFNKGLKDFHKSYKLWFQMTFGKWINTIVLIHMEKKSSHCEKCSDVFDWKSGMVASVGRFSLHQCAFFDWFWVWSSYFLCFQNMFHAWIQTLKIAHCCQCISFEFLICHCLNRFICWYAINIIWFCENQMVHREFSTVHVCDWDLQLKLQLKGILSKNLI